MTYWSPLPDQGTSHRHIVQVASGKQHALLLTDEGTVYSWSGKDGPFLGRTGKSSTPSPVEFDKGEEVVVQIACGLEHCLALTAKGSLFAWGENKAGQLGTGLPVETDKEVPKQNRPVPVKYFEGKSAKQAKSCSCGPESSACITTDGDVYVWGAISYYFFGRGSAYHVGDNCMLPVKVSGLPDIVQLLSHDKDWEPDRIALYKDMFACTISRSKFPGDLKEQIKIMKRRDQDLKHLNNRGASGQSDAETRGGSDGSPMEFGDMKTLNHELKNLWEEKKHEIDKFETERTHHKKELERIARELTICDQQDTALNELSAQLELKRSDAGLKDRGLDTQLNDISHFKASNKRSLMLFNEQRERLEGELMMITKDLATSIAESQQLEAREKLIKTLSAGNIGGSADASDDSGLRIAVSKRYELGATEPTILSSVGRFAGFREVLATSDRALQDISSALKEVSAASSGGDGVLESVLEANLKLRKDANGKVKEKLQSAEAKLGNTDKWEHKETNFFTETAKNPLQKGRDASTFSRQLPQAQAALGWMGGGLKVLGGSGAGTPKR